jgi:E3 ubiquitin-protein ligase HUWE1
VHVCPYAGFRDLIPDAVYERLQTTFTAEELKLLFEGRQDISISELQRSVQLDNFDPDSQELEWFWGAVAAMTPNQQMSLLEFITGCKGMPMLAPGEHVFTICMKSMPRQAAVAGAGRATAVVALPVAHTCSRTLDLPSGCFRNQAEMQASLEMALEHMGYMGIA